MKLSLNFLDKMDYAIFKKLDENHQPASVFALKQAFWSFLSLMVVVFLVQMFVKNKDTEEAILGVLLCGVLVYLFYSLRKPILAFHCWWKGLLYSLYLLFMFYVVFQLSMWVFFLMMAAAVLFLIYWIFLKPKSGIATVTYKDGTSEKIKVHGMGALGDMHGTNKEGRDVSFEDPNNRL